jgi:putative ABC transport system permease protein
MLQDLTFALRMCRRNPGFTALAVATLALGIGANTAIFSAVNAVLFQKLPLRDASRVMVIWASDPAHGWSRVGPTGKDFQDWREQSKSFEDLFLFEHGTGTVTGSGEPEQVTGLRVTTNFGDFLDVKPVLGRTFRAEESRGRHNLMILSYGYWQRRFASDPAVLGKAITLNAEQYAIIGVLPMNVHDLFPADVVVPADPQWLDGADSNLGVFGRLKPGVTLEAASSEMNAIAERVAEKRLSRKGWGIVVVPLESVRVESIRPALLLLFGAVGFVLLIACANVANLMLVRAVARQREVAVRLALGAGRLRLIRQFVVESVLLSLFAGVGGILVASWCTALLTQVIPERIPVPNAAYQIDLPPIHMDGRVIEP